VSSARALAWPPPEVSLWGRESGSGGGEERSPNDAPAAAAAAPPSSPSSLLLPPRVALVCSLRPERAITEVLQWTRDYGLAAKIAAEVAHEYLSIVRGDDDDGGDGGGEFRGTENAGGECDEGRIQPGCSSCAFRGPRHPEPHQLDSILRVQPHPATMVSRPVRTA